MKFLVPNYSCLQNPWLRGYCPQIPVLCPQLNLLNPPPKKIPGYATAHNTELVHGLLSGVLKLGLHGNHGSSKGDVAQPQPIHWLTNDSFRNSRSDGEMRWSTILLKWHLLHNPIVAGLWYNMIPHLIHVTPLKVPSNPSNKYGPMT